MVIVQSAVASKLVIDAPDTVVGDAGAVPVAITIMIQDADGGEAAVADDVTVNLVSTNTTTGSFSLTAGGGCGAGTHPRWYEFGDGILQRFKGRKYTNHLNFR